MTCPAARADAVRKRMKRPGGVAWPAAEHPHAHSAVLRTTFIVGFPGTEADVTRWRVH
jgi:tRNA A37 methylthiotransferase MiaB